jgi:short-subunit dehydrogenase
MAYAHPVCVCVVCFTICPGPVTTDMAREVISRESRAMDSASSTAISAAEVAPMLLKQIDESTRETDVFVRHNGETWPW